MKRMLGILGGILVLTLCGRQGEARMPENVTQPLDKGKLRAAAYLPEITRTFQLGSDDLLLRDADGKKTDFAAKIAALQKRLGNTVEDVPQYLELAQYQGYRGEDAKQLEAARKAEALLRPHLQRTDPSAGSLLARYCEVLSILEPNKLEIREKWARHAVQVAPTEWRCWDQLGSVRREQLLSILYGGDDKVPAQK